MFTNHTTQMQEKSQIINFMKQYGFATLVSEDLQVTHLPVLVDAEEGENGTLYGHFARANKHWQSVDKKRVVVVFSGPHSYISPTWYETNDGVPTWNYASVHAIGNLTLTDQTTTHNRLDEMVGFYEADLKILDKIKAKLINAIVGFSIKVEILKGKQKLGQHRAKADQAGVTKALSLSADLEKQSLYRYMMKNNLGLGVD